MAGNDTGALLRLIARDLQTMVMPYVSTASAQSLVGMMKTLLEREAYKVDTFANFASLGVTAAAPPRDLKLLIEEAERAEATALAGQQVSRESAFAQSGSGKGNSTGGTARTAPIAPDALTRYLRSLPDWAWVETTSIRQAAGGFSKDTFLIAAEGGGRREKLVIRRDQAYRPLITSVTDEAPLLSDLAARGLPVPKPLWVEKDASIFGSAVMATTEASGSADSSQWAGDVSRMEQVVRNSAQLLAKLHAVPVSELSTHGSGVPGSNGNSPREFVADLRRFWNGLSDGSNALVERLLDWFEENAPSDFGRTTIVHGDYGLHNQMVDGEKITAVLDWEFWHVGDPREDLAYIRPFMTRIDAWPLFHEAYVAAGGMEPDSHVERFYSALSTARVAMGCKALRHAFEQAEPAIDTKMMYISNTYADHFMIEAAKLAVAEI